MPQSNAEITFDSRERLPQKVKDKRANIGCAHTAIDSYVQVIASAKYEHRNQALTYADRALMLAVSLNDMPRIETVRDAILKLDEAEARDEDGAGIAFDLLINNKKLQLDDDTVAKLIDGQKNILARGMKNAEEENAFPLSVDRAAERLLTYYRSGQEHDEAKRVGEFWARAKIAMAKRAGPMLGAAWLRDVYTKLNDFGCPNEAEAVGVVLRDLSKRSMDQMVQHKEEISVPKKDMDDWTNAMLDGDLPDVLLRIVRLFIPDPDQIEKQIS